MCYQYSECLFEPETDTQLYSGNSDHKWERRFISSDAKNGECWSAARYHESRNAVETRHTRSTHTQIVAGNAHFPQLTPECG